MNENNDNTFNEIYELMLQYGTEAMPEAIDILFNEAMKIERQRHIGADLYARSPERQDYANGYKPRQLKTRMGQLNLNVPQTRHSDFYPSCLDRGLRSERALNLALAEMYIQGTSTRKVKHIVEKMCGFEVSSHRVSNASKQLDEVLEKWRNRDLGKVDYLMLDARYEKVRVDGMVRDCAVLIAVGMTVEGQREILGVETSLSEAEVHWRTFLENLLSRGLHGVQLIISDAHTGLRAAKQTVMPSVAWQRCQFHLQQNAGAYVTKQSQKTTVANEIREIFNASNATEAKRLLDLFIVKYQKTMPDLSEWAEENIPQGLTILELGLCEFNRKRLRTTNLLERLNQTIKKRTRVAKIFANKESCLRLVSSILIEVSEDWQNSMAYLSIEK